MAKVKLTSLTKEGAPERKLQTLYLSAEARKLLWQNRVDTGSTISSTVEALILKHLGRK